MKYVFTTLILLVLVFTSNAQANCNVKKAYAFYTVSVPGAAMADENGNTIPPIPVITRYIYLEWSGAKPPVIETVLYDKTAQTVELSAIDSSSVIPVMDYANNSDYTITAKKCNRIWQLVIHPATGSAVNQGCKNILIKFKGADKTCDVKLAKETQLVSMPRY